jgi:ferredoxin--NADP+ reductase
LVGQYTAGWIKRGPTGVIGTNKPDAAETVENMLADARQGLTLSPSHGTADEADVLVHLRQPCTISYADWQRLDALELSRGKEQGRPRIKFTRIDEMLDALDLKPESEPQ